ncbi:protocadherin Fat 1-like [Clytia hemisphaerica]|uniref:Uncharacterized protein n=1 Tax=Clytia hemisphaerica TaxID=252671 RepID=A0A7M5UJK0_9CNID
MEKVLTFCLVSLVVFGECTRFQREELGVPDRLRFTSGKNTYYNCDIFNGQLVSNLKIGLHIYNHKSVINFAINDTNFNVVAEKVQDFYFAHIRIVKKPAKLNEVVIKLVAKDESGIFIDETLLRINSPKIITTSAPVFVNSSDTNIDVYDDVFVGSTIGHLLITNRDASVIYYLDQKDSITLREFGVTVDGSIIVTKRLNHERKNNFKFQVNAKHSNLGPSASITLTVTVKSGTSPKKIPELRRLYQPLINQKPKSAYSVSKNGLIKFSLSELAPKHTILGGIGVKPDQIRYVIGNGNDGESFSIDSETGIISVNNASQIDYERKKEFTLEVNDYPKIFHISKMIEITILDENDNSPIFTKNKYTASIDENAPIGESVIKVSASDKDSGSNGLVHYTFSNKREHPFAIQLDGTITVAASLDLINQNSIHYLYVKALDMGQSVRRETETLVEVHIKSINNHKPVLKNVKCDIFYNVERKNEELFKLEAVDEDVSTSITFSTVEKSKDIFINQSSGVVYWKGDLTQQTAKINFLAFDGLHTSDRMQVIIRFVNEQSSISCQTYSEYEIVKEKLERRKLLPKPEKKSSSTVRPNSKLSFVETPGSSVYISENSEIGTFVGKYRVVNPNPQSYGIVLFSITNGNHEGKFNIDLHNGTLFLRGNLDREKTSQYRLEIEASDSISEKITTILEVEVTNVDDTPPVFENNGRYNVQVKEKENIGRTIVTVKANAVGDYGLTYSLVTPSTIFEVDGKTGIVRLKSSVAKQPYKEYFIEIQAANQTMMNPLYGYAVVHVKVIGLQNHPPLCLIEEQRIEISTSTLAGVIIGRVFAYDVDEGKAGKVTFAVKNKDNTHFDDYFSINRKSGLITLKKDLSVHDKGIVFRIQIEVSDQGKPALSTICHLYKIIVEDSGATQPSFTHTNYPVSASIPYNSSRGTFVTKLKAVLPGQETSVNVRYSLIDGTGIGLFTIDSVLGSIYVSDNTTVMPFYWLTVQAYMFSDSTSYRNAHVLIQVSGQRQGSLFFKPSVYHVNLPHKEEDARSVVQLYATDGAGRYNLKGLKYTIHAGDKKESFSIDSNGLMTTKDILDIGLYHLNVTVSNPNNKTFISYGYVVLDVKADNSEPPVFSGPADPSQAVRIFETSTPGFNPPYLFQVSALNPSSDERTTYQSTDTDTFTIDRFTGAVKSKASLKSGGQYFWSVRATNQAGKSTSKFYYIVVGRRPAVQTKINFKKRVYHVVMKSGSLAKSVIDLQKEIISSHSEYKSYFYVLSGNDLQNFHFPPAGSTSSLKVTSPLNYKRKPVHKLTILAFDGSSHANCQIEITIENDESENYLTASQACFEARVPENEKKIRNLITVPVTNSDLLPRVEYVMINNNDGSSPFVIDQHGTLNVKPSVSFDRELQDEYIVTAAAGLKKENATFCVNVFVEDANDHKPNFTQNVYKIEVLDSTPVGSSVMAVYATDKDTGSNARLSYSFQKENQYFGVDSKTGIVHIKKSLKDVANKSLTLMTIATDHGQKAYSGNAKLKIFVSYDFQRLEFSKPEYKFSISENLPKGTLVSDSIKINVSKVLYEIVADRPGDCSTKFWLGPFTAILLTYDVLDAEEFGSCTFKVVARVQNKMVSRTRLFLTILNVNDNKPEFLNASYTGHVTESMNSNTPVLQSDDTPLRVVAKDLDDGINGKIKYSFVEKLANIYFTIDEKTGEIRTNFVLDCEKHPTEFEFNVKATDEGTPTFYSIVPLTISVRNINDRIPGFVDLKIMSVRLPAYEGMIVGRLKAKDYDIIPEELIFELPDLNEVFDVHPKSGDVFVKDPNKLTNQRMLMVQAKVSDSLFHSIVSFQIQIIRYKEDSNFKFIPSVISAQVVENQENTDKPIGLVNPIGYLIGEQIHFRILNPVPVFKMGTVSGLIEVNPNSTFDREEIANYEIHVEAWKVNNPQMVARALVNVTVADQNDNKPEFVQKKFYKAIDIDDAVGTDLLMVTAVDRDAGENAQIRYSMVSGDGQEFFSIHPQTGQVTLKKKFIKSKASKQYSIVVKASDHGTPSLSSEATVEMFIINKDQPKFKSNYYGNVAEDAQIGDKVVTVYATGPKNRQVYYQIVAGDEYEQFHVGFASGEVIVAGRLDHTKSSSYSMKIRAIDSLTGSWSDTTCDVTILDVNNHYPLFEKTFYVVDVKENVATGSSILKVSAHDQDIKENADITYTSTSLGEDSMDYLSIDHLNGLLTLAHPLDAETKTNHLVQVTASDNGTPRKSSFTYVEIRVQDVNDNPPKFLSSELTFTYSQYEDEAHFVGQVHAYDADSSDSLTYSIVPSSDYVMVAKDTGSVYLKRDPSPLQQIKATIQVTDGLYKDTIHIIVLRTGSNNHAPELSQNLMATVKENNAPKSELVMKLEAKDPDIGAYGNVTFLFDDNYSNKYFTLKVDGRLFTTDAVFDREDIAEFILPVRAVDGGGLFTLANVTVTVQDENDCTPQFEFTSYEAHVSTSQVSEESLVHALAIDDDFGSNSELKYVAHGLDYDSPLVVDNKTGLISLAGYAKGLKYQFSVQVSDNGYPILQSRTGIQVSVKRWDHRVFAFANNSYTVNVAEDKAVGSILTQLTARLKDYKGSIKYGFIDGNLPYTKASDYFTIESGKIRIKRALDHEKITNFKLLVKARADNGESTNAFVYIHVRNINDNKPRFDPSTITVKISENTPVHSRVIQVKARDVDDPYGDQLTYKINDGDAEGMFLIDEASGWVYVKKPLDREVQETHKLIIQVSDATKGTINTAELSLTINLSDVNDWAPKFTRDRYEFKMKENAISSHVIGQLKSHDKDLDSVVRYYFDPLEKSNRMFSLDPQSGVITLLRPIPPDTYTFKVIAFDGVNRNSATVIITVEDIDDKNPQCLQAYYKIDVAEDWPTSDALTKFRVKKGDAKDTLSFYVQGDGNSKFEVSEQGTLKAILPLDYEQTPSEKFKIMVVDQSGHKCNSDIFLNLRDVNDNRPSFDQDLHTTTVRENTSQSVVIAQVRATDLDSYDNRKLTYSIIKNNEQRIFAIDQRGIVTVNEPSKINRKKQPAYSLVIQAKDKGSPSLSSNTKLQIAVLSASDIPPKFQQLGYEFNITENNEKDAVIGRIYVTASKNLIEEKIVMSVINDESDLFTVTSNHFTLKVKASLDYEKASRYAFDLKAHYESIPTLSSTVRVTVQVNDQNDHKPQFKEKKFDLQIDENVRSGTFFLLAYAEDKDGSRENSLVTYRLIGGPPSLPFKIGPQSGEIRVDGSLDHEKINSYQFEIEARDNGRPSFASTVKVLVNITDLNDNAPIIQGCHRVIVQERKPTGSDLLTLSISDVDSPQNGAPFSCSLLEGDSNQFEISSIEGGTKCVISSKELFDKTVKDEYNLVIRVADSGAPTQYSDCTIDVKVVEESYHPPVIQSPKIFYVIVAPPYGWTTIGQIKVFDEDKSDIHQYQIMGGNEANIFHIQSASGVIEGKPKEGSYSLSVEVSDGKYGDEAVFKIVVNEFNEKLKKQSVSVVINGVDVRTFVDHKMVDFVKLVAALSGTIKENVFIWSIADHNQTPMSSRKRRNADQSVVVALAVKGIQDNQYIQPSNLRSYIENSRSDFQQLDLQVSVSNTECQSTKCPTNQQCVVTLTPKAPIVSLFLPTGYMSFVSQEKCYCSDGSEGPVCLETNPCSHNPCKIGEKCVVTSTYFKCECMEHDKCDPSVDTVTLKGDSYVTYQLKQNFDELFDQLSMKFRTEATTTEYLFHAYGNDFFILEIDKRGRIKARFDFGSGVGFLVIDDPVVNDGKWHHINVERYGNYVAMVLDEKHGLKKEARAPGSSAKININGRGVQIGAGLTHDGKPLFGFKGCIKEPKLNNQPLPFSGTSDIVQSVAAHKVYPNCKDSGLCSEEKCPRFSVCMNTLSSYHCQCLPGHYGPLCKTKLTCKDNPCQNNARCTYEQARDESVSYKCTCKQGFTGGKCQIALGPCASRPCLNGGQCIAVNENSYICKCALGFTGNKCSINTNPCASSPCRNGGTCKNKYNAYQCICPPGKTGKQCSDGENCLFNKCLNGGSCMESDGGSLCTCARGFFGLRCQHDVDECLLSGNCKDTTCVNTYGDYYCNCTTGDRLKVCPIASTGDGGSGIPILYLVVGGAGVLLLIIIVILCCCFFKKRKRDQVPSHLDSHAKYPLNRYLPHDGDEMAFFPPSPPPRGELLPPAYYEETDQASAAMYDPSLVTFSGASSPDECVKKVPLKLSPSVEYVSEDEEMKSMPGYHWDYSEVPEDMIYRKMSREGSRILPTKTDQYYDDENLECVDMPELPERPASRRSSLPGYSESEAEIPELPELPQQVRLSRQSLRSSNQSPPNINSISSSEFRNRYSLLSDENEQDAPYLQDDDGGETTMSELTRVTRPRMSDGFYQRYRRESESSASDELDGYTETSFNSDDDATEHDPLDPANTRKLERDIQKLIKDLQRRTEED